MRSHGVAWDCGETSNLTLNVEPRSKDSKPNGEKVWKWNLSAGGAYLIEKHTNGVSEKQTPSAAFGSQYNRNIGEKITIAHTLNYIPAAGNFSDYLLMSVFSLSYQLSKPLKLTINNVVDFQSQPTAGSLKKNSQWFIGLSFGGKA